MAGPTPLESLAAARSWLAMTAAIAALGYMVAMSFHRRSSDTLAVAPTARPADDRWAMKESGPTGVELINIDTLTRSAGRSGGSDGQ